MRHAERSRSHRKFISQDDAAISSGKMKEPLLNVKGSKLLFRRNITSHVFNHYFWIPRVVSLIVFAILRVVECSGATAGAFLKPLRFIPCSCLPKSRVEDVHRGKLKLIENCGNCFFAFKVNRSESVYWSYFFLGTKAVWPDLEAISESESTLAAISNNAALKITPNKPNFCCVDRSTQSRYTLRNLKDGSIEGSVEGDLKHHFPVARVLELIIPHGTDVHQSNEVPLPQTSSISPNGNRVKTQFKSRYRCLHVFSQACQAESWRTSHFQPFAVAVGDY